MSHKLQDLGRGGGDSSVGRYGGGTEARVSLSLTHRLRLQAHLARGAHPSVVLQYSSDAAPTADGQAPTPH